MLRAILFDWGDTLMQWTWDPRLLTRGHAAGLGAIGRDPVPALTDRFENVYLPEIFRPGTVDEIDYGAVVRMMLADVGIQVDDDDLERFLDAEHRAWGAARQLSHTSHALLDALRAEGLKIGIVSNAFDPPPLMHRDLAELGVAERIDFAVFSSEVGRRKPDPAIFNVALDRLGVAPGEALFVGDRLYEDVRGASQVGMGTVQALWFRGDEHPEGGTPDFEAYTQMDVLNAARRLLAS